MTEDELRKEFPMTSGALALAAKCCLTTIHNYAARGELEFVYTPTGRMRFKLGQAGKVRALIDKSLAERGRFERKKKKTIISNEMGERMNTE